MGARHETPRTRAKAVRGIFFKGNELMFTPVEVRVTADHTGQSMSLATGEIMIQIPLEDVADMLEVVK